MIIHTAASAQKVVTLDGYLNDMQTVYHVEDLGWYWENQVHNRLNFHLYPTSWLHASVQLRNRFITGNTVSKFQGYSEMAASDGGWIDLSLKKDSVYSNAFGYVLSGMLDRAWMEFTAGNFVGTIGRQRINWGQTFVWNPNDIFNSYSYFEVDYAERPGSDAIRLQYYTGMASNLEVAAKIDSANKITAAGYFKFNAFSYDVQLIGGILSEEDLVIGTGWSGNILGASFRGEFSYFRDLSSWNDTSGYLMGSVGLDYTFANSLWLQTEVLYSSFASNREASGFLQLFSNEMNVKNLGFTEWSIFGSVSYPFTPLFNGSLAAIYFPDWKGFFIGPSFDLSLTNNLKASLIAQVFSAELTDPLGTIARQNTQVGYLRLKWSF
jgi:hypothetical protein